MKNDILYDVGYLDALYSISHGEGIMYDPVDISGLTFKQKIGFVRRIRLAFLTWQIKKAFRRTSKLLEKARELGV